MMIKLGLTIALIVFSMPTAFIVLSLTIAGEVQS